MQEVHEVLEKMGSGVVVRSGYGRTTVLREGLLGERLGRPRCVLCVCFRGRCVGTPPIAAWHGQGRQSRQQPQRSYKRSQGARELVSRRPKFAVALGCTLPP